MKKIKEIRQAPSGHWVGDGFPVRSLISYDRLGQQISPFLLFDYAGPHNFEPASRPRGVGEHQPPLISLSGQRLRTLP